MNLKAVMRTEQASHGLTITGRKAPETPPQPSASRITRHEVSGPAFSKNAGVFESLTTHPDRLVSLVSCDDATLL